jgi:hypothetical protein
MVDDMIKPILFHDIDGVLFGGEYEGAFQLRPAVKMLKWAHEHQRI